MIKNLVKIGVAVLTTLLVLLALWQFRNVVVYVLISLMLSATIRPLFKRLEGRRLISRIGWIIIYISATVGLSFFFFWVFKASASELQSLTKSVSAQNTWMLPVWLKGSFQQALLARLPSPSVLFQAVIGNEGKLVIPALLGIAQGIGGIVAAVAIILILSIYWSINQIQFERLWLSLLPSDQRKRARGIWRAVEPKIGTYIRGQLIQSLLAGLLLGVGYWLIGSQYPVLLGLGGGLACLIPVVGPVLAILLPLLVGLLTSVSISLFTGLYALIVLIAILIWVKSRLLNLKWKNPILTIILLIALADAFGIIGIMIAPPISTVCQIIWSRLVSHRRAAGAAAQLSDLKARLVQVKGTVSLMDGPHLQMVQSSLDRISNLIIEAEPVLQASQQKEPSDLISPIPPLLQKEIGD
jgi:predicted PurR-regulated permease PerM